MFRRMDEIDDQYDAIIIGAGIGGLVCACYLAKEGFKTLIIEKHFKVGGYCTSFERAGFTFDVAVHYIGSCRRGGQINQVLEDLELSDKIKFNKSDPCDKIILPDHSVSIRQDYRQTIEEFIKSFPRERDNIIKFFNLIISKQFFDLYGKLRKITFKELLDAYFENEHIKAAISILLGNMGLPASKIAALTAVFLYKEFILDAGYYPQGGMQSFSETLANKFTDLGGQILLTTSVNKIVLKNGQVVGVRMDNGVFLKAQHVVSNVDATQTFMKLLENNLDVNVEKKINKMVPSVSAYAIYLGLDLDLREHVTDHCTIWKFFTYDIEKCYGDPEHNIVSKKLDYFTCTFPSLHDKNMAPGGKSTMGIFICAPFKNKEFWDEYRDFLSRKLIDSLTGFLPILKNKISTKVIATPFSFYKYTLNKNGAMYGWASTLKQIDRSLFPQKTQITGLYLAGHWCTNGLGQGGISSVAFTGKSAAKLVIKDKI